MRLTTTGWSLTGLGLLLASVRWWPGHLAPAAVTLPLGIGLLAAVALAAWWPRRIMARWHAEWQLPRHVTARDDVAAAAVLTGPGALPPSRLEAWEPQRRRLMPVGRLGGHDRARLRPAWTLRFTRRGLATLPPLELVTRLPFGVVEHRYRAGAPTEVLVLPAPGRLHRRARERLDTHRGLGGARAQADGDEVAHLRPYRPGDHPHTLHWRATARMGRLVVAERHATAARHLDVVLDPQAAHVEERITLTVTILLRLQALGVTATLHLPGGPATGPLAEQWAALALVSAGAAPTHIPDGALLVSDTLAAPVAGLCFTRDDLAHG